MYLGIDSGGTKTSVLIVDDFANIIFDKTYSSLHIKQVGEEKFNLLFKTIVEDIKLVVNLNEIKGEYLAIPMYSEIHECDKIIENTIKSFFPNAVIVNDVIAGWAGGLACQDGICVVSGTGSIAVCVNKSKHTIAGGYGHIFGDEGSAYWIARSLLSAYSMQLDNRESKTILFDEIAIDEFNLLEYGFNLSRDEIAAYALKCDEIANKGCVVCIEILENAAMHLAKHVFAMPINNCMVSYSGSVFKSKIVLNKFVELLDSYEVIAPILPPNYGCVFACYINSNGYSTMFLEELKNHVNN